METAPIVCDTLIVNGFVVTGDAAFAVWRDGAVAIRGNAILEVGPTAAITGRYAAHRTIDATDRIVMPGLINTHNHSPLMVTRGMVEDVGFAPAYTPNVPQGHALSDEEALVLSRLGLYEMMRFGSTTVVDSYNHADGCARAAAETGLRAFIGGRIHDADMTALAGGQWRYDTALGRATLDENLAVFERWDGREDGRIRAVLAPHAADTCSRGLLAEVAKIAEASGATVHTHLAQSALEVEYVTRRDDRVPSQLFDELGLLTPRLIAGHCIHIDAREIERIGAAGVRVAHSPFGNAVSGRIAPVRALEAAGATITLCTDTKSGDMFEAMRFAVAAARIRHAGYDMDGPTVLAWATCNGAAALGLDHVGALAPGQLADLVILDATTPNLCPLIDGAGQVVYSANGANVVTVMVDGRVILDDGAPTLFDGAQVVRDAQRVARGLWQRYGR
jgi:5-methylthioadenosine/S-adenosylhomocysteine deaminase